MPRTGLAPWFCGRPWRGVRGGDARIAWPIMADMSRLDYRTAGESHGAGLIALVEGLPAGLAIDVAAIDAALRRRQGGYGRGGRMAIEEDRVEVLSGLRQGMTLG